MLAEAAFNFKRMINKWEKFFSKKNQMNFLRLD
jgi:hypothetical protein